ncbi:B-box zinc finger protein [Desulfitobacterium sp. AusDCA]|uniref:B-box zinc finger protein n=1 Tax=Desulfitobacterium sp. AusDCA TaxID=3240383 RepID=UPI003DA70E97
MNCLYHSTEEAQAICTKCKHPICSECAINVGDKTVCRNCIEENLFNEPYALPKKTFWQKFSFFCFSLIPGAAHMHLGLFRRGLQLMIIVFGIIFLADMIGLNSLIPLVIIPTWFFSFFESHNLRKQIEKGQTINDQGFLDPRLFDRTLILRKNRLTGGIIIVLGLLGFSRVIESHLIFILPNGLGNYYFFFKDSVISVGLIICGIYLIKKTKPSSLVSQSSITNNLSETHEPEST